MTNPVLPVEPLGRAVGVTATLSFVAGYVDVVGFIALFGLFTAHVTGNFILIGSELVHPEKTLAVAKLLALPVFIAVVVLTRLAVLREEKRGRTPWHGLLVMQMVLLTGFMLAGATTAADADGVAAMGVQNAGTRLGGLGGSHRPQTRRAQARQEILLVSGHIIQQRGSRSRALNRTIASICCVCLSMLVATQAGMSAESDFTKPEAKREGPLAYITVAGAPGDGEQALAAALAKRLSAAGVKTARALDTNVYSVEGIVKMTAAKGGRQAVRIDWTVFGPGGDTLGGVSQTKLVRKGSLDRKWAAAADAAARAAATAIAKLILLSPPIAPKAP